ncbi:MAG: hypothetical protein AB8H80_13695 [Planctomycetota bacterium]
MKSCQRKHGRRRRWLAVAMAAACSWLPSAGEALSTPARLVEASPQDPKPASPPNAAPKPSQTAAFGAALEHYRAGRFEPAKAGFAAILAAAQQTQAAGAGIEARDEATPAPGDAPQTDSIHARATLNLALCELQLLRSRDAELRVVSLVENEHAAPDAAFVLGLASAQHAERALLAARLVDAEPMAWIMATRAIERAVQQFAQAVSLRPDWPEAIRNLERVQRRRAAIERERAAATRPDAKKEQAPKPPDDAKPDREQPPEVVVPKVWQQALDAKQLQALQRRVRQRQDNKLRGRQQRNAAQSPNGRGY